MLILRFEYIADNKIITMDSIIIMAYYVSLEVSDIAQYDVL